MIVAKWGNSLAVRLPKELVDELGLTEGDDIAIVKAKSRELAVTKRDAKADFLKQMEDFRWSTPSNWKFDRDAANER